MAAEEGNGGSEQPEHSPPTHAGDTLGVWSLAVGVLQHKEAVRCLQEARERHVCGLRCQGCGLQQPRVCIDWSPLDVPQRPSTLIRYSLQQHGVAVEDIGSITRPG